MDGGGHSDKFGQGCGVFFFGEDGQEYERCLECGEIKRVIYIDSKYLMTPHKIKDKSMSLLKKHLKFMT
jgi:hypothetical protein